MAATDTAFDLREYWAIAKRRALLWILPLVLVTASAVGVSFFLEPRYRTVTTVMISDPQFLSRSVEVIVPDNLDNRVNPREQAMLIESEIKSSSTLTQLIDALDLDADPEVQKEVGKLLKLREGAVLRDLTYQYLIEKLREDVDVQVLSLNLVRIAVTHRDPQLGVRMADKLGELFMDQRRRRELYAIRAALDFTDVQLAVYRNKQSDSEERLRQFQKQSISTAHDEQLLNPANVNAIVAEYDATQLELETLLEQQERQSPVAAEERRIVSHLLRKVPTTLRTVLVTSADPYEGKSTLSGFLAVAAAQYLKKRTLLIDADLRRPGLSRMMGAAGYMGLADWLSGKSRRPFLDYRQRTPLERLHVLGSGNLVAEPGLLLETEIVEQLLKECSRLYDLVLIDSPPLLPVTDPLVFSPLCDATVLVIKAGVTQRQSVRRALQLVHQSGGHVAGCILNDIVQTLPGYYSASYYVESQT